ncbi:MAG: AsnC family protein [Promethearchaeota archaeon]
MGKKFDKLDIKIIKLLAENGNISLRIMAEKLDIKISTLYHRIQKIKNKNIIKKFCAVFNPDIFQVDSLYNVKISIKPTISNKFYTKFVFSFADYLKEEFPDIIFMSIQNNLKFINFTIPFESQNEFKSFINKIEENEFVNTIEYEKIDKIILGSELFKINPKFLRKDLFEIPSIIDTEYYDN